MSAPSSGWPRFQIVTTATAEATILASLAVYVAVSQRTLTATIDRLRQHPVGFAALSALTGWGLTHIWLDDGRHVE